MLETKLKQPTKKTINISAEDVNGFDRSLVVAVAIKYTDSKLWKDKEAYNALIDRFYAILRQECSPELLRDLGYPDDDQTPPVAIPEEEDQIVADCHSRLSHGSSRCSCGNHSEYTEMVEV